MFFRREAGEGEGEERMMSARVEGVSLLWAWPCPPRLPWCFFAPALFEAAEPRVGNASASSTAGTEGVGAREVCLLLGRECGRDGPLGI